MTGPRPFFEPGGGAAVLRTALRQRRPLIIFLDYDGTLAPIRSKPHLARIAPPVRDLLARLAGNPRLSLGIISGRFMADLSRKVRLGNVFLAASHGLKIRLDGRTWTHPQARACPAVTARLSRELAAALAGIDGVTVERKGLTLSVHYRNAGPATASRVRRTLERALRPHRGTLKIAAGKKVFEVMPETDWNKGAAVLKIAGMLRCGRDALPVYFGDDRTDEDAFRALRPLGGLTVRVGRGRDTKAEFAVDTPARVVEILEIIERGVRAKTGPRDRRRSGGR